MAAASSTLFHDQFLCSICLHTFEEPVSTPCGHNYCKSCITANWDSKSSDLAHCPLCKKIFNSRPQLQVNTEFRDMLEHFSRFRLKNQQEVIAQPGEVPCDVCTGMKLRAHKTCLVCLASYCEPHLEPHRSRKKHKLINPVPNLEDRVCKKHNKMLELFCLADEQCICLMCLNDDHAAHNAVPLESIFLESKAILQNVMSELKKKENAQKISADMMKKSIQQNKKSKDKDVAEVVQVLGTLLASLQRKQCELIEVVKQKQQTFEKQAEDHIKRLDQEVSDLSKTRSEIDQHLQTEDHLCFPQNCPPPPPVDCTDGINPVFDFDLSQHIYVEMVKRSVARIEETLSDEMERLLSYCDFGFEVI
ncbi:E3 ubiquitin/ISG15 ligase TRIM25-like, partial [Nothobranchius furzeri]